MTERWIIANATLAGQPGTWDLGIKSDRIASVTPHAAAALTAPGTLDAAGNLVSRAFVEPHIHPDKSYSLSDLPEGVSAADLEPSDAFARAARIKAAFTVENVERRARRAFELAVSNGVTKLRATADVDTIAGLRGLEGLLAAREAVSNLLDVELVAFPQEGLERDPGATDLLREALRLGVDAIGGWPNVEDGEAAERRHIAQVFDLAEEFDVDVDIHADCFLDPTERSLTVIAEETIRRGYQGRVLASHCVALELYPEDEAAQAIDLVARAGMTISIIPLNLADGGPRGLSRPQELLAAGVNVVAGSDNMNDGWYPLGTLNPLDRANMTFLGGSFDEERDVDTIWRMITDTGTGVMGGGSDEIRVGDAAELIVLGVPTRAKAFETPLGALTTVHRGRIVARRSITERRAMPLRGGAPSA